MKAQEIWNDNINKMVPMPEKQLRFLNEIEEVCKKYDLSIAHEDSGGAFIIEEYDQYNLNWLNEASFNWLNENE